MAEPALLDLPGSEYFQQIHNRIRRRYPDFDGTLAKSRSVLAGETTVLGSMEPCERCGTDVVPLDRPGGRGWWALLVAYPTDGGWHTSWRRHTEARCAEARWEMEVSGG